MSPQARIDPRGRPPRRGGRFTGPVHETVEIAWDRWGVPHLMARSERDAYVALGYTMAQERLWQLDYMRRLATGRAAAILGPRALPTDRAMRTLGLARVAARDAAMMPAEVVEALDAFAAGVNAWMERTPRLPLEFALLGYRPARWRPIDSIAIWKYRWWYNSGRPEANVLAEIARRALPQSLLDLYLGSEAPEETIVPDGPPYGARGADPGEGSNNWVLGPTRTTTGAPVLCNDPHNPFAAPSQWFEAQITAPGIDAIGAFYQGLPTIYIGRNAHVAWGVTNHVAPARDLYRERIDPDREDEYLDGGTWQPMAITREQIEVAGAPPVPHTVRRTCRGPLLEAGNGLLDDALAARVVDGRHEALSLRWIGHDVGTGLDASLALQRARTVDDVLDALRRWPCPPLNFVYAGDDGRFGYHVAGQIPLRRRGGGGVRDAAEPADRWEGHYDFDDLPHEEEPARGWVATANNPPWGGRDPHYLGLASWSDGHRFRRIRERIDAVPRHTPRDAASIHSERLSSRARELVPALLPRLRAVSGRRERTALRHLAAWDYRFDVDSIGASVFAAFWAALCRDIVEERLPGLGVLAASQARNVGRALIVGATVGWFSPAREATALERAFAAGVARLVAEGGPHASHWRWGRLHTVTWPHPLAELFPEREFSTGPFPCSGGSVVRAAEPADVGPFHVQGGATYRFTAELREGGVTLSTTNLGQSAHVRSRHYRDQTRLWLRDEAKPLWMDSAAVTANLECRASLRPA